MTREVSPYTSVMGSSTSNITRDTQSPRYLPRMKDSVLIFLMSNTDDDIFS